MTDFYEQVRARFANNIECPNCHNKDWEQFLYIQVGDSINAGCKHCAQLQEFKDENGRNRTDNVWG